MALTQDDVKKIADLARLNLTAEEMQHFTPQLDNILKFIEQMGEVQTDSIEPMAHPLDVSQRAREDAVTETNQRDKFQKIAPLVEAGLYLVPKVIDEG